jgi:hypothetical protein
MCRAATESHYDLSRTFNLLLDILRTRFRQAGLLGTMLGA